MAARASKPQSPKPDQHGRELRALGRRAAQSLLDSAGPGHGRTLVVGLSGGADSAALLFLLADTQERHGWRLRAAHVDHGIQDAAIRTAFRAAAAQAARAATVPLDVAAADTLSELAAGGGIEAAARRVRYRALAQIAERRRAELIAAAHTRDDQAETVLLRLLRGSGVDGLAAMSPLGPVPEAESPVQLARPLLAHTRAQTRRVCDLYGFGPVVDPTNRDLTRTRNRIRRELIPLLRAFNPQIEAALAELAQSARGDRQLLESQTADALAAASVAEGESAALDRRALLNEPPALRARVLRAFAGRQQLRLSAERTQAALAAVERGRGWVELGCGRVLRVADGRVALETGDGARSGGSDLI